LAGGVNAFPQIERCAIRQWAGLSAFERGVAKIYQDAGVANLSHPPLAYLWWVEVGARPDPRYALLPLMTVKAG
jgi:hypothetical protein